jgi:hypothetical protein
MAELIIVEGESGTGKSTSLRNMPVEKSMILAASDKPLPFRNSAAWAPRIKVLGDMIEIPAWLEKINGPRKDGSLTGIDYVIIEDHTHFQNNRILSEKFGLAGAGQNKYKRWEDFGKDVYSSVFGMAPKLKNIKAIIIMAHVTKDADGMYTFKTFGKMVGNTVDPVSYARIVLHAAVNTDKKEAKDRYVFITNNDGVHEAKSPMDMFPQQIPNDLWAAIQAIEAYDSPQSETKQPE